MKNSIKVFGITALVAVFAMAGCASMVVVDVEWDTLEGPSKARQYMGISSSEVKVYAHYKNGERRQSSNPYLSYNKDTTGTQTVTVSVGNIGGGTFQTEVMALTGIRIVSPPTKTTYNVGDGFNLSGLKVTGSWKDMPDAEIPFLTLMTITTGFDSETPGDKLITVNYKGAIARFSVTVVRAAAAPAASQPAAQQPAQQQPAQSASGFNPAANQPSPVGTWILTRYAGQYDRLIFKADGTGTSGTVYSSGNTVEVSFRWTASGNKLTVNYESSSSSYAYEISGNSLTWKTDNERSTTTWTRQ